MNKTFTFYAIAACFLVAFSSCDKKDYQTIKELDEQNIQTYINSNKLAVTEFENTGIYYSIVEEGTGSELAYEKKFPLVFSFKTLDGSYASIDTFNAANRYYDFLGYFPYGSASAGFPGSPAGSETGMKVLINKVLKNADGKIRIIVPSRLAYGKNGTREIPSNASLEYIVHVIDSTSLPAYEDQSILQYIERAGLKREDYTRTESGIYYDILEEGSGKAVLPESRVKVSYDLKFMTGVSFQKADSVDFNLKEVIAAWQEIVPKVKLNGKVRMLIPSSEAYGLEGSLNQMGGYAIAPFVPLDYFVEVLEVLE